MSRFFSLFAILFTLSAAGVSAQEASRPSAFQFSLGVGFGSSYSSLHDDLVQVHGDRYEDTPDAFSVTGSMTLSALAFHRQYQSGMQLSLLAGYRASVDSYLMGLLDTGIIHRHEATFGVAINRRVVLSLGGGAAFLHDGGGHLNGAAAHVDLRWGMKTGIYVGIPVNVSVFANEGESVVVSTVAIELGWQSLR